MDGIDSGVCVAQPPATTWFSRGCHSFYVSDGWLRAGLSSALQVGCLPQSTAQHSTARPHPQPSPCQTPIAGYRSSSSSHSQLQVSLCYYISGLPTSNGVPNCAATANQTNTYTTYTTPSLRLRRNYNPPIPRGSLLKSGTPHHPPS